jgi:hypothetical protein
MDLVIVVAALQKVKADTAQDGIIPGAALYTVDRSAEVEPRID